MQLFSLGIGTERLEEVLQRHFPKQVILRIDRDTVRHKNGMENMLKKIHEGEGQILIGTQMLAKGHHFPNVTLVGIINMDTALYSTDFRANEQMGQLILQVAGRAGRAEKPGQVYLQTHHPNHPLLQSLIHGGYGDFSSCLLQERRAAAWPPFSFLALLRAEASQKKGALDFLDQARRIAENLHDARIQLLGPIPAPMERKAGVFRGLLLLQSSQRQALQQWLQLFVPKLDSLKCGRKVRWSLDVDPLEMF
jgi:primosomal protein N' (replication factor Y)